jgi:hypothetical protein
VDLKHAACLASWLLHRLTCAPGLLARRHAAPPCIPPLLPLPPRRPGPDQPPPSAISLALEPSCLLIGPETPLSRVPSLLPLPPPPAIAGEVELAREGHPRPALPHPTTPAASQHSSEAHMCTKSHQNPSQSPFPFRATAGELGARRGPAKFEGVRARQLPQELSHALAVLVRATFVYPEPSFAYTADESTNACLGSFPQ